jgi:DNA modification methylase
MSIRCCTAGRTNWCSGQSVPGVRLWSNPGELVLTPFAGIGSELYQSVKLGRRAIGIELKPSYWRTAVENLTDLESEMAVPSLFDEAVAL